MNDAHEKMKLKFFHLKENMDSARVDNINESFFDFFLGQPAVAKEGRDSLGL